MNVFKTEGLQLKSRADQLFIVLLFAFLYKALNNGQVI